VIFGLTGSAETGYFVLDTISPQLSHSPNGGEAWYIGDSNDILWTASDTNLMLKVEAKHDGIGKFAHWDHFVQTTSLMTLNEDSRLSSSTIIEMIGSCYENMKMNKLYNSKGASLAQ